MKAPTDSYPRLNTLSATQPHANGKLTLILAAVLLARMAGAQTLYWDPGAGATWDTGTPNWSTTSSGSASSAWISGEIAYFSDSAGPSGSYTVTLNGTQTAGGLTFATGTATLTGGMLALNGSAQVSVTATEGIIASPITGSVNWTKTGGGQLDLSGTNTFTGNITNRAGILTLDNSLAGGEGAIVLNPGAPATLNSSLAAITLTNNVEILGSSSTAEIDAGANNTIVLGGVVSGGHNWNANGPGMLVLSNANTFGGILTVEQGTLVATMNASLGGIGNDVVVSNNATLTFQGTFTYTDNKVVVLNGSGAGGGPALEGIGGDSTSYGPVVLAANSVIGTTAGSLELVESITGSYNLVIAGEVAFGSSGNTYNNTLVSQGDLYIENGSSAGTGQVTVNAGATFEGVSSVAAPGGVNLSGAISPGAGEPGSLGTASETWQGGASYDWTLGDATNSAGVGYSTLNINGGLTILASSSQPFIIYIGSFSPDSDISGPPDSFDNTREYDWTIASATGGISGFNTSDFRIDSTDFDAPLGGGSFRLFVSGNSLILEFDPAPVISCPGSIVANNDTNECGATVSFAAVATNYFNLEPVSIAYETNGIQITSPCVFPKGTTLVTSIATDQVGDTATCSFTVTVNDVQPPTIGTRATNQTIVADADTAKAALPDITHEVGASDNCGGPVTLIQIPPAGAIVGLGTTNVTVWAIDQSGNSNFCTAAITVIYTNAPTLNCVGDVTVTTTQDKDPYATGYATATSPDGPVTVSYSDNYTNLTGCDSTGSILRTWTAIDGFGNSNVCVQTVNVIDTNAPYFTYVPAPISVANTLGQCGAFVSFGGAAEDLGYLQDFENPNWLASTNGPGSTLDWDDSESAVYRVPSGINGIVSPNGVAYAVIDSTVPQAGPNYSGSGAFTFLGGLSSWQFGNLYGYNGVSNAFGLGYRASLDIYINLNDPAVTNATETSGYAWDLSTSASGTQSNFLSDFVFHAAAYDSSGVVIGASTGSSDSASNRGSDLRTAGPYGTITNSGWYKFEWNFYSNSDSTLSVAMKVRDTNGAVLFAQTIASATNVALVDGHPNYMWFTFLNLNQLPIADTIFERNEPVTPSIPSGTLFPIGTTTVTDTTADACGNSTNASFTVTVADTESPTLVLTNSVTVALDANGSYTLSPSDISNLTLGSDAPCGITNVAVTPNGFNCGNVGPNSVSVVITDAHGNSTSGTGTISVQDLVPPVLRLTNAVTVTLDATGNYTLSPSDISYLILGSSDACGITGVTVNPNSFDCSDVGSKTVTVVVTDSHGNSTTNSTTIAVQDTTPPSLVLTPIHVTLGPDGTYTLSGTDEAEIAAGSHDSCGIQSTNFNPASFSYCQTGSVPVAVTMTDVHGNISTGSVPVTVSASANPPMSVYVDASYLNECNVTFPNNGGNGSYYYGYNAFNTIQAGLNAVAPGGTVTVAPGTYNESPIISNPVTLKSIGGTSASTTTIALPNNPPPTYVSALTINASSVNVEGFTLVGYDSTGLYAPPTYGEASVDILLNELVPAVTNIDIGNNIIEVGAVATNQNVYTGSDGFGIETTYPDFLNGGSLDGEYPPGTSPSGELDNNLVVHNNVFQPVDASPAYDTPGNPFFINPAGNFSFVSNTIVGGLGISTTSATNSLIADNIVLGVSTNDNSGGFATFGYPDPDFYGGNTVIMDNVISNIDTAIAIFDSEDVTVENNVLNNNGVGVSVQDSGYDPVYSAGNTVQIINNSLAYDAAGVVNTSTNSAPVANSNWWGDVSGPAGAQNPYGSGSLVTGNVTVNSWLASGINENTGIGFTPEGGEDYPPTQLAFTTEPGGANLGSLLSPEPVLQVEDVNGHVTPWVNATISIAISNNPASGVLIGTTNKPTVSGVATFTDLYVTNDGGSGYTLAASAPGLNSADSSQFDVTNPAPQIVSLSPFYTRAGASQFPLFIFGSNFVANSEVDWNGQGLSTIYVSSTQLTATVPASDVAAASTALVNVVSPSPGGGTSASLTFYIQPTRPPVVYVDKNYANVAVGTWVNWPYTTTGTNIVGYDAFATIQAGVNAVAPGGTVNVAAGTYAEEVTIGQPLALLGPNAAINPNTGTRAPEAIIEPDMNGPEMLVIVDGQPNYNPPYNPSAVIGITIESSNVLVKGLTVDGYNPSLTGGWQAASDYFNAAVGIGDYNGDNSLLIENNIVRHDAYSGVDLESDINEAPTTNSIIKDNLIEDLDYNTEGFGQGVILNNNYYAKIAGNCLTNVAFGIAPGNFWQANPGDPCSQVIVSNTVSASVIGIWLNNIWGSASTFEMNDNTSVFMPTNGSELYSATIGTPAEWDGYEITSISGPASVVASNNIAIGPSGSIGYNAAGYNVWNTPTTGPILITGGSVSSVNYGVWVNDFDGYQTPGDSTTATINNVNINGATSAGVYVQDDPRASANGVVVQATVTGNTVITGGGIGVLVQGNNAAATVINNDASITGNGIGISVDTGKALIENNDLTGNSLAGISVTNNAIVDAGDCSGSNVTGLGTGSSDNGSSKGLNNLSGYGFDSHLPWAIENSNNGGGTVLAENDNFGVTNPSQNIDSEIDNPNGVEYSQGPALVVVPANVTTVCASDVPAGAMSLGQFTLDGGYYSGNNATVSFSDSDSTNFAGGTNIITILRIYTIGDLCGPLTATQTITLNETPPVVNVPANITVTNDPGVCGAIVNFTVPAAGDNCVIVNQAQTSPSGALFPVGTTTVSVMATDNNGLSTTNSFTVTVIDGEPPVIINAVNIVRAVDPGQTFATVGFSINATDNCSVASMSANWQANSQSALGNTLAVSGWQFPTGTNTVTVTATDVNGNSATTSFTVAVIGLPQITGQPESRTNNAGTTATFTVVASSPATLTYQWYKGNNPLSVQGNISGATGATLSITTVSNIDAATYYVVVSNFAGTVTSSNATLTVIDSPAITTITPASQTNNASTLAQFTVNAAGTPPFAYQWTKITATATNVLSDVGNIFGSISNVLTVSNLLAADQAEYVVTVSNSAGIDTTDALLFVNDPAILAQPSDITNRLGSSVTFSVTAAGTAPLSYQWEQDGFDLPGATGSTLTLNNINDSSAGNYTVVVSNSVNQVMSDIATLTVTHPPVITTQPGNTTVNLGQNATLNVAVNGDTPFTYQWYQNNLPVGAGNVSGGTTRQLTITGATTSNAGTYYVAITNAIGVAISSNAIVTVIVPPAITNQPAGLTTNAGSTVTFTVNASGTAPAFQWYQITPTATNALTDGGNVFGSASNVLTITNVLGTNDGNYIAVASNRAGTNVSSGAVLIVIDPIITNEPASVTANLGSPASFTVGAYGTSPNYQWYQNGNAIAGAKASAYSIASVADASAGNYTVVVSNMFGVVTSTPAASLTVIDPPVITSQPQNVTANAGGTAVFAVTNTGTSPSYQWYFGNQPLANNLTVTGANGPVLTLTDVQDGNEGTYSVVVSNQITMVTSSNAVLTVIDPPVITSLQHSSQTNNATTTAQFTVNVGGTAPFIYHWTKITATLTNVLSDVGNISGSSSNVLTITNVLAADQAEYLVTVSNPAGAVTTNGTLVVIDPAIFAQPVGQTNFLGSTVTFSVTAAGTSPLKYQWLQNGSPLFGANTNLLTLRNLADSDAGTYTVVITNSVGSVTSAPAVLVTVSPLITQQPANVVTLVGLSTSFSVNVNGELPFSYQWQFNGTNIMSATNRVYAIASVQLSDAGEYDVVVQNPVGTQVSHDASLYIGTAALLSTPPNNNGPFTVMVTGVPGYLYTIQGSTNLVVWFPVITNTAPFTYTNNSGLPYEFYRALYQQ